MLKLFPLIPLPLRSTTPPPPHAPSSTPPPPPLLNPPLRTVCDQTKDEGERTSAQGCGNPTQKPHCKNAQGSELKKKQQPHKKSGSVHQSKVKKKNPNPVSFATYFQVMENDRDRLMTFFLCWVSPIVQKKKKKRDPGRPRRTEKRESCTSEPRRRGARQGDAPTLCVLAAVHAELRRGRPPLATLSSFFPPARQRPALPRYPGAPASGLPLPGPAFPGENRFEVRAPSAAPWKTQSGSLPLPLSAPSSRPVRRREPAATRRPPARVRWVVGPGTRHPARAATAPPTLAPPRKAEAGARLIRGQFPGSPRKTCGGEKGRPEESRTPLPVRLHLLHVAHNAPAAAPGREEPAKRASP